MASPTSPDDVVQDAREQIKQLRDQVEQLMRDRVTPILTDAAGRAQDIAREARDVVGDQAEAVSGQVRDRPLTSILIAGAVGYLLGRVLR